MRAKLLLSRGEVLLLVGMLCLALSCGRRQPTGALPPENNSHAPTVSAEPSAPAQKTAEDAGAEREKTGPAFPSPGGSLGEQGALEEQGRAAEGKEASAAGAGQGRLPAQRFAEPLGTPRRQLTPSSEGPRLQRSTQPNAASGSPMEGKAVSRNAPARAEDGLREVEERGIKVSLNGKEIDVQPPPILARGEVFLSFEAWERLGVNPEWTPGQQMVVFCHNDRCVPLRLKDGGEVIRSGGRIYARAAKVGMALGMKVIWKPEEGTLSFTG